MTFVFIGISGRTLVVAVIKIMKRYEWLLKNQNNRRILLYLEIECRHWIIVLCLSEL